MKFSSILLSVLMAGGLVAAAPSESQLGKKIVTFYDGVDYKGQTYTLFNDRLHYCVNFPRGPLIVLSAKLFGGTVCDLYTEKDCTIESYKTTIYEDTPDTGTIEQFSMHCTTVPRS